MRHIKKYKIQNKHKIIIIIQDIQNKKKRPKTLSNSQDSMGQVTIETKENPSLESSRRTDP